MNEALSRVVTFRNGINCKFPLHTILITMAGYDPGYAICGRYVSSLSRACGVADGIVESEPSESDLKLSLICWL